MKKLLFKTFLMAVVACACLSLSSCGKSAEALNAEADDLVTDGKIDKDKIDDALDLYDDVADKMESMVDDVVDYEVKRDGDEDYEDADLEEEVMLVSEAYDKLRSALYDAKLDKDQKKRFKEINKRFKKMEKDARKKLKKELDD